MKKELNQIEEMLESLQQDINKFIRWLFK